MFIVRVQNDFNWFIRNSIWTSYDDRATIYKTREEAEKALLNMKKKTKPALYKTAEIINLNEIIN